MENKEEFEFIYKRDPNINDNTDFTVGDETVKYQDIVNSFPINKDIPISILIYWDDICQFTSIGLIEALNVLFQSNAKIDLEHFFTRPNLYSNGMNYVYKMFEKTLTKDKIDMVKKEKYWQILEISLKSSIFASLIKISNYIDRIGFYFPYEFPNCISLKSGLNKFLFNDEKPNGVQFYYATKRKFNNILGGDTYNAIITPNIVDTYKYILDNKLEKISIIGPENHNGIDQELAQLISKLENRPLPNYCSISLYKEQIYV